MCTDHSEGVVILKTRCDVIAFKFKYDFARFLRTLALIAALSLSLYSLPVPLFSNCLPFLRISASSKFSVSCPLFSAIFVPKALYRLPILFRECNLLCSTGRRFYRSHCFCRGLCLILHCNRPTTTSPCQILRLPKFLCLAPSQRPLLLFPTPFSLYSVASRTFPAPALFLTVPTRRFCCPQVFVSTNCDHLSSPHSLSSPILLSPPFSPPQSTRAVERRPAQVSSRQATFPIFVRYLLPNLLFPLRLFYSL